MGRALSSSQVSGPGGSPGIEKLGWIWGQSGCIPPRCGQRRAWLCRSGAPAGLCLCAPLGLSGLAPLAEAAFTFMVMSSDESEVLL